jgi:hypothetical protein
LPVARSWQSQLTVAVDSRERIVVLIYWVNQTLASF